MPGLKVRDVAARLNVSEKTVYKWLQDGLIPATRLGKTWLISDQAVDSLLNPPGAQPALAHRSAPPSASIRAASETARESSSASTAPSLAGALEHITRVASGAITHGITGILGPRRSDPSTAGRISEALNAAEGEVLLQGIGLREFFGDQDYTLILRKMAAEDRPARVRALLVNPVGQFARARTVAEDGQQFADDARFRAGPLFGDSWRSLNVIASMKKTAESLARFSLEVRFVDHWPAFYMVMADRRAFVEMYHFGRPQAAFEGSTIDGLVPMLELDGDSDYFQLLRNHFDYIWAGKNPFIETLSLEQVADAVRVQI